ncbi:hypothetical protein TREES_T100012235 [Tupaia chinensis]|uniref:Uncharacterized protein n=1 Tax=Tupaia chinensis TaxID=246437 RepID=L9JH47_TUPCH|nr:hypothetical protein TREES_T100012235 [Tupaia chinensis]
MYRLHVLHTWKAFKEGRELHIAEKEMAIDIHRGLEKVDGSWVDISIDRYKGFYGKYLVMYIHSLEINSWETREAGGCSVALVQDAQG